MTAQLDTLVLGGGVAGLATAWHLAQRGAGNVRLLEREPTLGSQASAQNAAILRTFGADAVMERIARASASFLLDPPDGFCEHPLVEAVGLVLLASGDDASRLRAALDADAGPGERNVRELTPDELERVAPHVRRSPGAAGAELALLFPDEGRIDVAALIDAFARGARRGGVRIDCGTRVERLVVEGGRVVGAELAGGDVVRARTTVVAAGAWSGKLGATAGSAVRLRPTRRHLLVTATSDAIEKRWPVVWIEDAGFYCRPESGGMLLSACDLTDVDPDRAGPDPDVKALVAEKTARYLPDLEAAGAAHFWHGLRTLTADDRFAVGPDPDVPGLFWVAGLGGHGMSAGAEVGRIAASLLAGEGVAPELDPARLTSDAGAPRTDDRTARLPS